MLDAQPGPTERRTVVTAVESNSSGSGSRTLVTIRCDRHAPGEADPIDVPTHVRDALLAWLLRTDADVVDYLARVGRAHAVAAMVWDRGDDEGPGSAPVPAMIPPGGWPPAVEHKTFGSPGATVTVLSTGERYLTEASRRDRLGMHP